VVAELEAAAEDEVVLDVDLVVVVEVVVEELEVDVVVVELVVFVDVEPVVDELVVDVVVFVEADDVLGEAAVEELLVDFELDDDDEVQVPKADWQPVPQYALVVPLKGVRRCLLVRCADSPPAILRAARSRRTSVAVGSAAGIIRRDHDSSSCA
jgi:hypothetical protein